MIKGFYDQLEARCSKSLPYTIPGKKRRNYHVQLLYMKFTARDDIYGKVVDVGGSRILKFQQFGVFPKWVTISLVDNIMMYSRGKRVRKLGIFFGKYYQFTESNFWFGFE